jgi:acetyl-CoA C-acetyltransferase
MATGIKDKVAIIGMGCTRFGERWDAGAEELMVEAFEEGLADAGIEKKRSRRPGWAPAWKRSMWARPVCRSGHHPAAAHDPGHPGGELLRHRHRSISRRLLRGGLGGLRHLPGHGRGKAQGHRLRRAAQSGLQRRHAAVAVVAQPDRPGLLRPAGQRLSRQIPGGWMPDLKRAIGHVSVKSHANGAINPKAHLRKAVTLEQVLAAPIIAHPLGLFDCCGVSDGAACAIVTTPEIAASWEKRILSPSKPCRLP